MFLSQARSSNELLPYRTRPQCWVGETLQDMKKQRAYLNTMLLLREPSYPIAAKKLLTPSSRLL